MVGGSEKCQESVTYYLNCPLSHLGNTSDANQNIWFMKNLPQKWLFYEKSAWKHLKTNFNRGLLLVLGCKNDVRSWNWVVEKTCLRATTANLSKVTTYIRLIDNFFYPFLGVGCVCVLKPLLEQQSRCKRVKTLVEIKFNFFV